MADHNEIGSKGELFVQKYLKANGYEILEVNWRFKRYEIDIIAKKGETIAIVEVKTRSSDLYESPEEAVSEQKKKHLIVAADNYIAENDLDLFARFDIAAVQLKKGKWEINYIEDAFTVF